MLHKFRHLYPQGSLLSELVNLEQGLYVVKVTVKNQDVILGSGLAAAETVEKAEDQARIRALMTLFTTDNPQTASPVQPSKNQTGNNQSIPHQSVQNQSPTTFQQSQPAPVQPLQNNPNQAVENNISASFNPTSRDNSNLASDPSHQSRQNINPGSVNSGKATPPINQQTPEQTPEVVTSNLEQQQNGHSPNYEPNSQPTTDISSSPTFILENQSEAINSEPVASPSPPPSPSPAANISHPEEQSTLNIFDQPLNSPSTTPPPAVTESAFPEAAPMTNGATADAIEFDFNEIKYKIDLEMKRLGWTKEQGRDYLLSTYGKRSRLHLKDDELLEFWRYLETLP